MTTSWEWNNSTVQNTTCKTSEEDFGNLNRKYFVNLDPNSPKLEKPSALCFATSGILICADDGTKNVIQLLITFDGVTVNGEATQITPYLPGVTNV